MAAVHTAGTGGIDLGEVEPHHFQADIDDPGYRPHCRRCGQERAGHPYRQDVPHGRTR